MHALGGSGRGKLRPFFMVQSEDRQATKKLITCKTDKGIKEFDLKSYTPDLDSQHTLLDHIMAERIEIVQSVEELCDPPEGGKRGLIITGKYGLLKLVTARES